MPVEKCIIIVLFSVLFTLIFVIFTPGLKISQYHAAIKECQQTLPRNVTCKITAIVDNESKN